MLTLNASNPYLLPDPTDFKSCFPVFVIRCWCLSDHGITMKSASLMLSSFTTFFACVHSQPTAFLRRWHISKHVHNLLFSDASLRGLRDDMFNAGIRQWLNYTPSNITKYCTYTLGSTKLEQVFECRLLTLDNATTHKNGWKGIIRVSAFYRHASCNIQMWPHKDIRKIKRPAHFVTPWLFVDIT